MVRTFTVHAVRIAACLSLSASAACRPQPAVQAPTPSRSEADFVDDGYQRVRRSDVAAAVTTINGRQIETRNATSVGELLERVPGVRVNRRGGGYAVRVRGATGEPLLVIDGVPHTAWNNMLDAIPPTDVQRIDVLRDAAVTSIYGMRGGNGVIVITTRRPGTRR